MLRTRNTCSLSCKWDKAAMTGAHTLALTGVLQVPTESGLEFGERGHDCGPALCVLLTSGTLLPAVCASLLRAFRGRVSSACGAPLTPIPSGCLRAACSSPFPQVHTPTPKLQHPVHPTIGRNTSQAGAHMAVAWTTCITLSVLPATDHHLHFTQ